MSIDIKKYKAKLEALKTEILASIEGAQDSTKPVELDQTMVGRLSRMDALQQQQMALASKRRRQQELQKIEMAFKRIKDGDYGYCVKCDEEIAQKRLDLSPTITTCIKCAS